MQNNVNLLSKITSALLKTEVSKKTNNPYTCVDILFSNDYRLRVFLTAEQKIILSGLLTDSVKIPVDRKSVV